MQTDELDQLDEIIAYVQSRLSHDDTAAFEQKIQDDADLRANVAALMAVRGVFGHDAQHDQGTLPDDGWARLAERIDKEAAPTQPRIIPTTAANDNWLRPLTLLQAACVAAVAIFGWQVAQTNLFGEAENGYVTASANDDGPLLRLVFNPDSAFQDISDILSQLDGQIVDGPSAIGLFTVAFPNDAARDLAFDTLIATPNLVNEVTKD